MIKKFWIMSDQLQKLEEYYRQIDETSDYISELIGETPEFGIVLGSGLGKLANEIENPVIISYDELSHFPQTTVPGHSGRLIFGEIKDKKVLALCGRFHYYEGHDMSEVVYPIRVFGKLGIKKLILSNASGGVNPNYKVGDIMLIKDHINMMMQNPLIGPNIDKYGPRFVDMHEPYDLKMLDKAEEIAKEQNMVIHKGTYVAVQGPTFETPAEYGMIRYIGGDAVGMSTVPEVIAAKHMNMRVFALSIITDLGSPDLSLAISHKDVLEAADKAIPRVVLIVRELIKLSDD